MIELWRKASIRVRLLVFLAISLSGILAVLSYFSLQALEASSQQALNERLVIARLLAARMDAELRNAQSLLQSAINSGLVNLDDGDMAPEHQVLQNLYEYSMIFKRVNILDIYGNILIMEPFEEYMVGENLSDPPYNFPLSQVTRPYYHHSIGVRSKKPGAAIILPIPSPTGGTSGFIYGWIDFAGPRAAELLFPYKPGLEGYTDIIDSEGMVLLSTDVNRLGFSGDLGKMAVSMLRNQQTVVGTCSSCHDLPVAIKQDRVMAFAPLSVAPWGVALYQPSAEVFAASRSLAIRLVAQGFLALALLVGAIWLTTHNLNRPLQDLTNACQHIAAGDLSLPAPIAGPAEFTTLGHAFNDMRQALLDYRRQVENTRQELEKRVAERTVELVQYQEYLEKANNRLNALNSMAAVLMHSLDLDETIHNALQRVLEIMSVESGGVYLYEDGDSTLRLAAHQGVIAEVLPKLEQLSLAHLREASAHQLEPAASEHVLHTASQQFLKETLAQPSLVYIPLRARSKSPGSLFIASPENGRFNPEDIKLLEAISWQVAMAVLNAQLYRDVLSKEQERAVVLRLAISAQEDERKRIARELHDETSQAISTLLIGLDTMEKALAVDPTEASAIQASLKAIARQMSDDIKRIMADLRPSLLDDIGLAPAISWYGNQRLRPLGISLHFEQHGFDDQRLPVEMETALFRIFQEALTNVIRHAQASEVMVQLVRNEHSVQLMVSDNGCGFNPKKRPPEDLQKRGLGLMGMRERIEILGGRLEIQAREGEGSAIIVEAPLPHCEAVYG